jgi:hypothetical protein
MVSKALGKDGAESCAIEALTANDGHSQRCSSPFCKGPMKGKTSKRFCSDRCRLDGHVIRRAKQMMDQVGVVRFVAILDEGNE